MEPGLGGSTPQFNQSGRTPGAKALFHSVRDIALIKDKTLQAGYGALTAGTVVATNAVNGKAVPYVPVAVGAEDVGRAFLLADIGIGTTLFVTMEDSYKFEVGDTLVVGTDAPAYQDLGAITDIDRDTYPHMAEITFTTTSAAALVADQANAYVKTGAAGNLSLATFVMDQDVFTGTGADAKGANTSVVISNAILYLAALVGYDAAAKTALGSIDDGQHVILK